MKIFKCTDLPIKLYGLNVIDPDKGNFWRLSADIMKKMPQYKDAGKRCFGAEPDLLQTHQRYFYV